MLQPANNSDVWLPLYLIIIWWCGSLAIAISLVVTDRRLWMVALSVILGTMAGTFAWVVIFVLSYHSTGD